MAILNLKHYGGNGVWQVMRVNTMERRRFLSNEGLEKYGEKPTEEELLADAKAQTGGEYPITSLHESDVFTGLKYFDGERVNVILFIDVASPFALEKTARRYIHFITDNFIGSLVADAEDTQKDEKQEVKKV